MSQKAQSHVSETSEFHKNLLLTKGNDLGNPVYQTIHEIPLCSKESIPYDGLLSTLTIVNNMRITIRSQTLELETMK